MSSRLNGGATTAAWSVDLVVAIGLELRDTCSDAFGRGVVVDKESLGKVTAC